MKKSIMGFQVLALILLGITGCSKSNSSEATVLASASTDDASKSVEGWLFKSDDNSARLYLDQCFRGSFYEIKNPEAVSDFQKGTAVAITGTETELEEGAVALPEFMGFLSVSDAEQLNTTQFAGTECPNNLVEVVLTQ